MQRKNINVGQVKPDVKKELSGLQDAPLPSSRKVGMRDIRGAIRNFAAPIPRIETLRGDEARVSGFTLIELLVVVLIIGILAAVAVPQYQKAVIKSRYATLKDLTHSIAQAQEIYYLANGAYTSDFDNLSIEMPAGKKDTSTTSTYRYDWGSCKISALQAMCTNNLISMQYQLYLQHTNGLGIRNCVSFKTNLNDIRNQVCKSETGKKTTGDIFDTYIIWTYPR